MSPGAEVIDNLFQEGLADASSLGKQRSYALNIPFQVAETNLGFREQRRWIMVSEQSLRMIVQPYRDTPRASCALLKATRIGHFRQCKQTAGIGLNKPAGFHATCSCPGCHTLTADGGRPRALNAEALSREVDARPIPE